MATTCPDWPFQLICADYFELNNHSYLAIVERFSGWLNIYHFKFGCPISSTLISTSRSLFIAYCIWCPRRNNIDDGPQFTSNEFQNSLHQWGVRRRRSSANYPQSNRAAELGVKAAKRLTIENMRILNLMALLITTQQHKQLYNVVTHPYLELSSALLKYCFTVNYDIISLPTQYTISFTKTGSYLQTNAKKLQPKETKTLPKSTVSQLVSFQKSPSVQL